MGNMAVFARSLHLGRFAFAALFLLCFFVSGAWGECTANCGTYTCGSRQCSNPPCEPLGRTVCNGSAQKISGWCGEGTSTIYCSNGEQCMNGTSPGCGSYWRYTDCYYCSNECEADSLRCINSGKEWIPGTGGQCGTCNDCDEQCQCEQQPGMIWNGTECVPDTSLCSEYHAMCQKLGGEFSGTPLEDGCSATCNTCGSESQKRILEAKSRSCCGQGLAPSLDQMCSTPLQSGQGMTVSTNANLQCSDPNLSDEAMQSYVANCASPNSVSSSAGEGGSSGGEGGSSSNTDTVGIGRDYYPILDTIRDSISHIKEDVSLIATCLTTPGACAGLMGGDSVSVNVPSDSVILKGIATKLDGLNSTLDTSVQNSSQRLGESISNSISVSTDTLIDSMRKYMGAYHGDIEQMDSANRKLLMDIHSILSQIEVDSSGVGRIVGKLDSALGSGPGADSNGVSYNWLSHGDALGDSILGGSGYGGLDFAGDSLLRDSLENAGYSCDNDSCCIGSRCIYFDSDSLINDSLTRFVSRMGDTIDAKNESYLRDSTTSLFQEVKDSLHSFNPLGVFDSTMLNTLGAKIPNSNTCPEHCSKFQVSVPIGFLHLGFTFDYGLCLGRAVFANGNVLSFLRFIIRLIISITCISAVMWNASRIRR